MRAHDGFPGSQPCLRQQLAHRASFRAELVDEVVAVCHEWPDGCSRVRSSAFDDLGRVSASGATQLNESSVIRTLLACVALVDLLRELGEQRLCAPPFFDDTTLAMSVSDRSISRSVRTSRPSGTWSLL